MIYLRPRPKITQILFVLPLELITVNIEVFLKRAARNRVFLQAILLKKPQTQVSGGYLLLLISSLWKRFYLQHFSSDDDVHEESLYDCG